MLSARWVQSTVLSCSAQSEAQSQSWRNPSSTEIRNLNMDTHSQGHTRSVVIRQVYQQEPRTIERGASERKWGMGQAGSIWEVCPGRAGMVCTKAQNPERPPTGRQERRAEAGWGQNWEHREYLRSWTLWLFSVHSSSFPLLFCPLFPLLHHDTLSL